MILSFFFLFFWLSFGESRQEVVMRLRTHVNPTKKKTEQKKKTDDELPRKMRKMGQKEMVATKYSREKRRE